MLSIPAHRTLRPIHLINARSSRSFHSIPLCRIRSSKNAPTSLLLAPHIATTNRINTPGYWQRPPRARIYPPSSRTSYRVHTACGNPQSKQPEYLSHRICCFTRSTACRTLSASSSSHPSNRCPSHTLSSSPVALHHVQPTAHYSNTARNCSTSNACSDCRILSSWPCLRRCTRLWYNSTSILASATSTASAILTVFSSSLSCSSNNSANRSSRRCYATTSTHR